MSELRRIDPAEVRRLGDAGWVSTQIAAALGFNYNSITNVARKHGIKLPNAQRGGASAFWDEHDAVAITLFNDGLSFSEIGRRIGATKNAVVGRFNRLGLIAISSTPYERRRCVIEFPVLGRCVFPIGDPREPEFRFCGAQAGDGMPYCPEHHRLCYRPAAAMEDA